MAPRPSDISSRSSIHFWAFFSAIERRGRLGMRSNQWLPRELQRTQGPDVDALEPVGHAVKKDEEIAPADDLVPVPSQAQVGIFTAPDEQLADSVLRRDLLEWLFGVGDRERDENAAGPGGDLVNVEVEPSRKQHDFR